MPIIYVRGLPNGWKSASAGLEFFVIAGKGMPLGHDESWIPAWVSIVIIFLDRNLLLKNRVNFEKYANYSI